MGMLRRFIALAVALATLVVGGSDVHARWIENHVLADDVRIEVGEDGKAVVEHRLRLKTNGSVRFRRYRLRGIDEDAVPLDNSYALPARDALSGSLRSAVPLSLTVKPPSLSNRGQPRSAALEIKVKEGAGLRRGTYVLVLRYRIDLRASGRIRRDGGRVRIDWRGPRFDDGFDNGRVTFVIPAAPTAPRGVEQPQPQQGGGEVTMAPTYLFEVRRTDQYDEVEIMRPFIRKDEAVAWAVRVDLRAIANVPTPAAAERINATPANAGLPSRPSRKWWAAAAGLFFFYAMLVWLKAREVRRRARRARALVPPLLPLPLWLRVLLAPTLLVAGVASQLVYNRASWGALAVVVAGLLGAHGAAKIQPQAWMRAPGRWLTISEKEAFGVPARRAGAWLDAGSWRGRLLMVLLGAALAAACWWLARRSFGHALMVGFDAVALLLVFATGREAGLPPDPAVAPIRFFRKLVARLRKDKAMGSLLRIAPRLRIAHGEVDADEMRLRIAPRLPLRGFGSIEVGMTYALGWEASVAMPEVIIRVVGGSPCDKALASVSRRARITPGRKPDERVIALAPRLPTLKMTAALVAALAARVVDRQALAAARPTPKKEVSRKGKSTTKKSATKRSTTKRSTTKKSATKKSATKRSTTKKRSRGKQAA